MSKCFCQKQYQWLGIYYFQSWLGMFFKVSNNMIQLSIVWK